MMIGIPQDLTTPEETVIGIVVHFHKLGILHMTQLIEIATHIHLQMEFFNGIMLMMIGILQPIPQAQFLQIHHLQFQIHLIATFMMVLIVHGTVLVFIQMVLERALLTITATEIAIRILVTMEFYCGIMLMMIGTTLVHITLVEIVLGIVHHFLAMDLQPQHLMIILIEIAIAIHHKMESFNGIMHMILGMRQIHLQYQLIQLQILILPLLTMTMTSVLYTTVPTVHGIVQVYIPTEQAQVLLTTIPIEIVIHMIRLTVKCTSGITTTMTGTLQELIIQGKNQLGTHLHSTVMDQGQELHMITHTGTVIPIHQMMEFFNGTMLMMLGIVQVQLIHLQVAIQLHLLETLRKKPLRLTTTMDLDTLTMMEEPALGTQALCIAMAQELEHLMTILIEIVIPMLQLEVCTSGIMPTMTGTILDHTTLETPQHGTVHLSVAMALEQELRTITLTLTVIRTITMTQVSISGTMRTTDGTQPIQPQHQLM